MAILSSIRKVARAITETLVCVTVIMNSYEEIISDMFEQFAAVETEHNWSIRNTLCQRLTAQLEKTKPSVPKDFHERIKALMPSFLTSAGSERTSLAVNAIKLLGSISKCIGSYIHPHLDYLLPKLISVCGSTKKLCQTNSNETIMIILQTAGYSPRLLHHICSAFSEKGKPIRKFAPVWLATILHTYQHTLDVEKDYPLIEKAITTGLNDGEKDTREATRAAYWIYAKLQKNTANKIMDGLNPHAATALRADPNNPNKSSEPAKPPRPESALSQIRAAKSKQSQAQQSAKRNTTPMSIASVQSSDLFFGPIDRIDAPDGVLVPLPPSSTPPQNIHTMTEEYMEAQAVRRGWAQPVPKHPDAETSSLKTLMAAPVRRPRVVATPMSTHGQPTARPTSKGETAKMSTEPIQRPALEKRGGRQTPTILEHGDARPQQSVSKKTSAHPLLKTEPLKTSTTRPTSSSSEPAGLKSPKRQTAQAQPKSVDVLPLRHQKSSSASEPRTQGVIPAAAFKTTSPPHVIEGKENADVERAQKHTTPQVGEILDKARRSLASITEALRHGRLDALGYRKLRKLVETYPEQLFTSHEQFDAFYALLMSSMAPLEEYSEPREQRRDNLNHPFYNRFTMITIALLLLRQYPYYGEPQPGMTLVALLKARGNHSEGHNHAIFAIERTTQELLELPATIKNNHAIIDTMTDTLLQIEEIILKNDPIITPSTLERKPRAALDKAQSSLSFPSDSSIGALSYTSEFGKSSPTVPDRLPIVMGFGLHILTKLILSGASQGRRLYDVQEQRLSELARNLLATYKQLLKREVMAFCVALHTIIRPEERFFAFFEDESDRNLVYYCVQHQSALVRRSQGYSAKLVEDPRLLPTPSTGSGWTGASFGTVSTFDAGSEESGNWKVLGVSE